jgi:hypothetical protein
MGYALTSSTEVSAAVGELACHDEFDWPGIAIAEHFFIGR